LIHGLVEIINHEPTPTTVPTPGRC